MNISLENEVVVVTGGAKRLGRAIALECAASGASVAITYNRSQDEASTLVAQLRHQYPHRQFATFGCELSQTDDIARLNVEILQEFGKVTALVNNAAIFQRTPFEETSTLDWERAFDDHLSANLKAPYLLSKHFGDHFLEQRRGCIVNMADIHGLRPLKNYASYCISKAGIVMLTEVLAKALAPHVRVNCLCPGTILEPSQIQGEGDDVALLSTNIPQGRAGTPEEIAAAVVFLIGGPQFISGAVLPVDGAQRLK
jgi:pteridine reductase